MEICVAAIIKIEVGAGVGIDVGSILTDRRTREDRGLRAELRPVDGDFLIVEIGVTAVDTEVLDRQAPQIIGVGLMVLTCSLHEATTIVGSHIVVAATIVVGGELTWVVICTVGIHLETPLNCLVPVISLKRPHSPFGIGTDFCAMTS